MPTPLECLPNTYRAFFSAFSSLTTAQKQLIQPILEGRDIILQASTGSGKTEAVLAPATEKLIIQTNHSTIIYLVPTRALALDMNRRIKPIYQKLGLKSGIRTGDGKHLRDATPHLLIMTPESLDVLLGSQNLDNKHFLKHVAVMIIDEVHIFLGDNRGRQLSYLRDRLCLQSVAKLQTIALSATIDNAEDITQFFHLSQAPFFYQESVARTLNPSWVHLEDEGQELGPFFDSLYRESRCKKLLVFANSRKKCEQIFHSLKQNSHFSPNVFLHYSNLSTQKRKAIERSFREEKMGVCIATSTLELGIDIGDIDGTVLIGPPPSTMAFLQRIGRGNRRQQHIHFWGICYGQDAERQLIRFLAFFELAKEHQLEKYPPTENSSVLFQQILSCLYAKKAVSLNSLHLLFKERPVDLSSIFHHMVANHWLKATKQPGLYEGGWRYVSSLKKKQIWSNFPPTDEEYDVILECEKIAVLPLSMVRPLEMGDVIQLIGKVLKVLRIEEKTAACEVWVEASSEVPNKELTWWGFGALTPFEVAQKMGAILSETSLPQGLLNRTRRLLVSARDKIAQSFKQPNGILCHQLGTGVYRFETFLGSVANDILCDLIKVQCSSHIEGLSVHFDDMGLECNEWLSFDLLNIPHTIEQFQDWISCHLSLLRGRFSWNSWIHWLPEDLQCQEIASRLYDARVINHFQRYHTESKWLPLPCRRDDDKAMTTNQCPIKDDPWSLEHEREAWGMLSFPELSDKHRPLSFLTATQVQRYVTQKLCSRLARFQRLDYHIQTHPRFDGMNQDNQARQLQGTSFKKRVLEALKKGENVCEYPWQQAVMTVASDKKPLFLVGATLKVDLGREEGSPDIATGNPDLIYIKLEGSHICLEVWDIQLSHSISYAQKWRIAFYTYLLDCLIARETFLFPVQVSRLGGLVYPSSHEGKLFDKAPFVLAPYKTWMPRLITQWRTDASRPSAVDDFSLDFSCTSCHYFSYCYQETLLKSSPDSTRMIISKNIESNDFPKNTEHWYFIYYDHDILQWQCWEKGEIHHERCLLSQDFSSIDAFRLEFACQLHKEWTQSIALGKNPHLLVDEPSNGHRFQKAFQSSVLKSLWARHAGVTAVQTILQTHFSWPIHGRITASQIAACLGISRVQNPPLSLYHREVFSDTSFDLYRHIWNWCLSNVKSTRVIIHHKTQADSLIQDYLSIHHRETECHLSDIIAFQKNPLQERVQQFRAIGPMRFQGLAADPTCYPFSIDETSRVSKFRAGDFLKLSPVRGEHIQEGFSVILDTYSPEQGTLTVRPLSRKMSVSKNQSYALDEDATDWNSPKIANVLNLLQNRSFNPDLIQLLQGALKSQTSSGLEWVETWYPSVAPVARLNPLQKKALTLPFSEKIGFIEGPPGTGKTHLLVWTLMALMAQAKYFNRSMKILVTAQSHHAIDQILTKAAKTLPMATMSGVGLWKYGRFDDPQGSTLGIGQLQQADALNDHACLILGATGYGVYQLLEAKKFPKLFDWVVFDEASQLLSPYACMSLLFGKGQALFYGDTQQLAPILKGDYETTSFTPVSVLQELKSRYGAQNRVRLNETYRMNSDICQFASEQWYDGELQTAVDRKDGLLKLTNYPLYQDLLDDCLDPSKSMVVVQLKHLGAVQSSEEEAIWIANAVKRLMSDYALSSEQIGIISPHRL
ncbi:MAG: DEAD/DEAH box helicase, partial [Legionellales bacterium]|nr:DEAD/DEAH box helicase [Legionellales bacterium]